jgi:hypothetical protein
LTVLKLAMKTKVVPMNAATKHFVVSTHNPDSGS